MSRTSKPSRSSLGIQAMVPWGIMVNPVRSSMFSKHLEQRVVLLNGEVPKIMAGPETVLGETMNPLVDPGNVIKVVERRCRTKTSTTIVETYVIYYNLKKEIIDLLVIKNWMGNEFGYTPIRNTHYFRPGDTIYENQLLSHSPSFTQEGYAYGKELLTAFTSIEGNNEDGLVVSDELIKTDRLAYERKFSYQIKIQPDCVMRNLYGTPDHYQPIPLVGDNINNNGLLCAILNIKNDMLQLNKEKLTQYHITDELTWSVPGSTVRDIQIIHNKNKKQDTPDDVEDFLMGQYKYQYTFYADISKAVKEIETQYSNVNFSPELKNIASTAMIYQEKNNKIALVQKKDPLPRWTIQVDIVYTEYPNIGYKLAGRYGDKATITQILPKEQMPKDYLGRTVDIIHNSASTIARSNPGRNVEMTIRAALNELGIRINAVPEWGSETSFQTAKEMVLVFYKNVSPDMYGFFNEETPEETWIEHLEEIKVDKNKLYYSADNPVDTLEMCRWLWNDFKLTIQPLMVTNPNGKIEPTNQPIETSHYFWMLLDKAPNVWNAVTSPRYNATGVPTTVNKGTVNTLPYRLNPGRTGEAEVAIFTANCPPLVMAELSSRVGPDDHQRVIDSILESDDAINIYRNIDRTHVPYQGNPILKTINHYFKCTGTKMTFVEESENPPDINELMYLAKIPEWGTY